ncbi:MAG: hypothetical protein WCX86_09435 [Candidatus Hydrogenedentales bacterium]
MEFTITMPVQGSQFQYTGQSLFSSSFLYSLLVVFPLTLLLCVLAVNRGAWSGTVEEEAHAQSAEHPLVLCDTIESPPIALTEKNNDQWEPNWFILPAVINVYPKLESERLIRKYFNPGMRLLAPGFDNVRTVSSLRDDHLLWVPDFAVGRVLSPNWALYLHFGYSGGTVRTKANDRSLLLLPLRTDFEIFRSSAYLGLCIDGFPWGIPEPRRYKGIRDHLRHTKPFFGFRLTQNYAGYKVKAKAQLSPLPKFLNFQQRENWWVTTLNLNIGADIPINERNVFVLNGGYNFSFHRAYDFNGVAITAGWKHYF